MRENIRWPPNGCKNMKFNPKATMPELDVLKTKSTSNIQAIKLNIFSFFFKRKFLRYSKKQNLRMCN